MGKEVEGIEKESVREKLRRPNNNNGLWWPIFIFITLFSFSTHFYKLDDPPHVCWDETHFGKMASWYINHTFFFDVHPPLGKMMIALTGYLSGYNGTHPFTKPGEPYDDHPYMGMRGVCAALGSCLALIVFNIVWDMTTSLTAASFAALFVVLDNGTLTLTRYILLDSYLLFFIIMAFGCYSKFSKKSDQPFTLVWWIWLTLTGIFLADAVSVKFVGVFTVLFIGLLTAADLWEILGDLTKPLTYFGKHFLARVLCLILLPATLYVIIFYVHLSVLYKSGTGDGHYSSIFQTRLEGNPLTNASMPYELAYGAVITLKNYRPGGAYLHSHHHLYPEGVGPRQQQITGYLHKDDNNKFIVKPFNRKVDPDDPVAYVHHGDLVRLEHLMTARNLHTHYEKAPLTKRHYQVTGYGENGTGDVNDVWKIDIPGGKEGQIVTTLTTHFRLVHYLVGCALHSHAVHLPSWAWEQLEVTCNPNVRDKNNLWNIEENIFDKLPNVSLKSYAPGFVAAFIESHIIMIQGNAGLKPKEGEQTSRPWHWPIDLKGQHFSLSPSLVYLLGNPLIWWTNLALLVVFLGVFFIHAVREKRGCPMPQSFQVWHKRITKAGFWFLVGWALHYLPFWVMTRILYFHHYFPAFLFSSMISGLILEYILESAYVFLPKSWSSTVYHWLLGAFIGTFFYSFYLFSPLVYSYRGTNTTDPNSTLHDIKWMSTWEF